MVAYYLDPRMIEPVRSGLKRQVLVDSRARQRDASPGDALQLRCRQGRQSVLIATARCIGTTHVCIDWKGASMSIRDNGREHCMLTHKDVDGWRRFAQRDGFKSYEEMAAFYRGKHWQGGAWEGLMIQWDQARAPC